MLKPGSSQEGMLPPGPAPKSTHISRPCCSSQGSTSTERTLYPILRSLDLTLAALEDFKQMSGMTRLVF